MSITDDVVYKSVISGLRSAINDHGAITKDFLSSAAKRVSGIIRARMQEAGNIETRASKTKRVKAILLGRQKARLALKMLIEEAYPCLSKEEHQQIWDDYTRRARVIVDAKHRESEEKRRSYLYKTAGVAMRHGEDVLK